MVTFGIYGLYLHHQYSNEMKRYANIGKGGFKLWHLLFLIPPLHARFAVLDARSHVQGSCAASKQLEARTGHMTKLSLGFLIMWSLGGMVLGGGSMLIFNLLPSFGSFDLIKTIVPAAVYMWTVFVTWKAVEDSLNTSWTSFSHELESSTVRFLGRQDFFVWKAGMSA